jgi:hypothetical protein
MARTDRVFPPDAPDDPAGSQAGLVYLQLAVPQEPGWPLNSVALEWASLFHVSNAAIGHESTKGVIIQRYNGNSIELIRRPAMDTSPKSLPRNLDGKHILTRGNNFFWWDIKPQQL